MLAACPPRMILLPSQNSPEVDLKLSPGPSGGRWRRAGLSYGSGLLLPSCWRRIKSIHRALICSMQCYDQFPTRRGCPLDHIGVGRGRRCCCCLSKLTAGTNSALIRSPGLGRGFSLPCRFLIYVKAPDGSYALLIITLAFCVLAPSPLPLSLAGLLFGTVTVINFRRGIPCQGSTSAKT